MKAGVGIVLATILLVVVFTLPLDNGVRSLARPVGTLMTKAGTSARQQLIALKGGDKEREHSETKNQLLQARLQLVELDRLRKENEELRLELSFAKDTGYDTVVAGIVNYQPDPTRSLIRINVGSEDGIDADMPVISDGALIGVTRSVTKSAADVILLGDIDFRALAIVSGRKVPGVVKGQIGDGITMEQLPRDESVEAGDAVVTSGLDGVFPRGILIGSITSLSETPGSVFMVAQIERSVDPRTKHVVTVIRHD